MKKIIYLILMVTISTGFTGCSDFKGPNIRDTVTSPWDVKPPLSIGMTKQKTIAQWGEPDIINRLPSKKWGIEKEEWIYWGRYPNMPIDYMYLSRTKHLIFEGNVLVDFFDAEEVRKK